MACCVANGQVLFQTGFEPPSYTNGALNGQNGWTVPSATSATVESTTVSTGTQGGSGQPRRVDRDHPLHSSRYLLSGE